MKRYKILLCLLAAMLLLPVSAQAAGRIDTDASATLTLTYRDGSTPLAAADFSIYRVAALDEYGAMHITKDFASYAPEISAENSSGDWRALAAALEGYVRRDEIPAADSGTTDQRGRLTFPTGGGTLLPGLYLVIGERLEQDGIYYDPTPFLILLPTEEDSGSGWSYDVSAAPKFTQTPVPEEGESVRRKVIKVWDDAGCEQLRPASVTVQLLRDGKVYDTVKLNQANNWRYEWTELDADHRWSLVEIRPDGYMVTISREGITFVVTNHRDAEDGAGDHDAPDVPDTPNRPSQPDQPDDGGRDDQPTLPQTGQLWWPVPLLLGAGAVLIVVGILRRKEE